MKFGDVEDRNFEKMKMKNVEKIFENFSSKFSKFLPSTSPNFIFIWFCEFYRFLVIFDANDSWMFILFDSKVIQSTFG